MNTAVMTPEHAAEMGLTAEEFDRICTHIGRIPNMTELGIFSAMWSEHCSYKSSRKWLKTLPTKGEKVIQGPGENAGVVDIGDGWAAVFKIESHNHPSSLNPIRVRRQVLVVSSVMSSPWGRGLLPAQCPALR